MERLDVDSGVFSTASCAMEDPLNSPALSDSSIDDIPTIVAEDESATRRVNELCDMTNNLRMRSQWKQTVQLYGGAFASSGETTPRSGASTGRLNVVDSKALKRSCSARSSLKSTGVKSPRRKKMVRFADSMGLDLEHIRHILVDDFATVPDSPDSHPLNSSMIVRASRSSNSFSFAPNRRYLMKRFNLPESYNLPQLIAARKVCLESLTIVDLSITGVIRVANIAFEKQVHVRYTLDGWATWTEARAAFIDSSSNGAHDLFSFSLFLPHDVPVGSRCEFCIRYSAANQQFWDNNDGANYTLEFCSSQPGGVNNRTTSVSLDSGWSHFLY